MENKNFSHFGVKDPQQEWYIKNHGKKVEPRQQAIIDVYNLRSKPLESVRFIITIQDNGHLKAEIHADYVKYLKQLNKKIWLKKAVDCAIKDAWFLSMDENQKIELNLIMQDGRYNFEHDKNFKLSPVVITDQQIAAINANLGNNN